MRARDDAFPRSEVTDTELPKSGSATGNSETARRSAFVTGAARGIGLAIATRLAADGYGVTLVDLPAAADDLAAAAERLRAGGAVAEIATADVASSAEVDRAVAEHVATHGGLDVLVANAGIALTAPLLETSDEQFARSFDVNVAGIFYCYRAAARHMIEQGRGGRIIGAASLSAHRGSKLQSIYGATKHAILGLSRSFAQEVSEHGITVNVYSPGIVNTAMWDSIDAELSVHAGTAPGSVLHGWTDRIPLGRLETPEDVAGVVSFLASPDAAYITGQAIVVDGGVQFS